MTTRQSSPTVEEGGEEGGQRQEQQWQDEGQPPDEEEEEGVEGARSWAAAEEEPRASGWDPGRQFVHWKIYCAAAVVSDEEGHVAEKATEEEEAVDAYRLWQSAASTSTQNIRPQRRSSCGLNEFLRPSVDQRTLSSH